MRRISRPPVHNYCQYSVTVSIAESSWTQTLQRGILQGSPYSAELFARTIDYYLGALCQKWSDEEDTWLQSIDPGGTFRKIFTLLYADDLILLATSHAQATRMLQQVIAVFKVIGLQLSLRKCKFIASPCLPCRPPHLRRHGPDPHGPVL